MRAARCRFFELGRSVWGAAPGETSHFLDSSSVKSRRRQGAKSCPFLTSKTAGMRRRQRSAMLLLSDGISMTTSRGAIVKAPRNRRSPWAAPRTGEPQGFLASDGGCSNRRASKNASKKGSLWYTSPLLVGPDASYHAIAAALTAAFVFVRARSRQFPSKNASKIALVEDSARRRCTIHSLRKWRSATSGRRVGANLSCRSLILVEKCVEDSPSKMWYDRTVKEASPATRSRGGF